jgi:hypothetical protein
MLLKGLPVLSRRLEEYARKRWTAAGELKLKWNGEVFEPAGGSHTAAARPARFRLVNRIPVDAVSALGCAAALGGCQTVLKRC